MDDCNGVLESRWGKVGASAVALLVGSLLPSPLRRHPAFETVGPDKLLHLLGHAGFATVLADALADGRREDARAAVLAVFVSAFYGAFTGHLQNWVPGREAERADFVAGVLGSILGVLRWRYLTGNRGSR